MRSQAHADPNARSADPHAPSGRPYLIFAVQLLISAVIMYLAMYLMINVPEHFHLNLNTAYMTLAMVAPMALVMMLAMRPMFRNRRLNLVLYVVFGLLLVIGIWFTRAQTFIGDAQFLRSMIPHHSGALKMCHEADITDPEILALCEEITETQLREIARMEAILERY